MTRKEMLVPSQPNDNNIVSVDEEKYNRNQEIIIEISRYLSMIDAKYNIVLATLIGYTGGEIFITVHDESPFSMYYIKKFLIKFKEESTIYIKNEFSQEIQDKAFDFAIKNSLCNEGDNKINAAFKILRNYGSFWNDIPVKKKKEWLKLLILLKDK